MSEIQGTIRRLISTPTMDTDPTDPDSDHNQTQSYIIEAISAEKQLQKLIHLKGLLHTDVQELFNKVSCVYEKIILNDLEKAEVQDIEYSLWKLHYKHIDEYRKRIRGNSLNKDCINSAIIQNSDTLQNKSVNYLDGFISFLSGATEFYQDLIKKIGRTYELPEGLQFFNRGGFCSSMDSTEIHRRWFSCHRCFVCLGDLARYKELYGNPDVQTRNWSVAATHYLNASKIWPDSGNPHNQLAVLAIYVGDELLALYHCMRSLAVKEPFPDAWDNLILLFEKNRSSQLPSLSDMAVFDFFKPSERSTAEVKVQSSDSSSNYQLKGGVGVASSEGTELWPLIVRTMSYFYIKPSFEDFPCIFGSTIKELEALLSHDDARLKIAMESYQHMDVGRTGPFRALQLLSVLIFTIHTQCESPKLKKSKHLEYMQQPALIQQAFTITFIIMGRLVSRCMTGAPLNCSPLLTAILIFAEWLVGMIDEVEKYATNEICASATGYFFDVFVDLLNQFDGHRIDYPDFSTLWEDDELQGFFPIFQFHGQLDSKNHKETRNGFHDSNESEVRISRILVAAMNIVNKSSGSQKWIFHEKTGNRFYTTSDRKEPVSTEVRLGLKLREVPQLFSGPKDVLPLEEVTEAHESRQSEDDDKIGDVQRSSPAEEEEVILFKPITRQNSAPLHLPLATSCRVPSENISNLKASSSECLRRGFSLHLPTKELCTASVTRLSNITGSSSKFFWQEPIPEDSVMDTFREEPDSPRFRVLSAKSDEAPSLAGPPSLNAWVVNKDSSGTAGSTGSKDTNKQSRERMEDIASAYLTDLTIGGSEVRQQHVKTASFVPSSHIIHGSTYEVDSVIDSQNPSRTSSHSASRYIHPVPSAPLLPDDATWLNANSFNDAETKNFKDVIGFFPVAPQLNNYSNFTGNRGSPNVDPNSLRFSDGNCYSNLTGTQCPPSFDPYIPSYTDGYSLYYGQASSTQGLHQFQANPDQTREGFPPNHLYTPTMLGRFQGHNVPRVAMHPMKHPTDMSFYLGDDTGANEQKKEKLFPAHSKPSRFNYDAVRDLRSEQQLLLKYLKEKEWYLQQDAHLRGSA